MDVDVIARHCEVSDRFRQHAEEKVAKLEKYDHRVIRVDVEVSHERNPRLAGQSYRVELTLHSKGPIVRAEAVAEDKLSALDLAVGRLQAQLRKAAGRRRIHHGTRTPASLSRAMAPPGDPAELPVAPQDPDPADDQELPTGPVAVEGEGPLVVREKEHPAVPMTLDQALYEMELVGHDFYLFIDKATEQPAVVYRRRGYDYGVIRLKS